MICNHPNINTFIVYTIVLKMEKKKNDYFRFGEGDLFILLKQIKLVNDLKIY